jgi:hypothetical protein
MKNLLLLVVLLTGMSMAAQAPKPTYEKEGKWSRPLSFMKTDKLLKQVSI